MAERVGVYPGSFNPPTIAHVAIAAAALAVAFLLGWRFGAVATLYVALQTLYSGPLKHIVIIDVLTIAIGYFLHLYRVIFGDDATLHYVVTQATDIMLMIPMTYAAITGIVGYRRMRFANRAHRIAITASIVYITTSVPLHIYCSYIIWDTHLMTWFPMWFSYFLLIVVYPVFLTLFWKLQYKLSTRCS